MTWLHTAGFEQVDGEWCVTMDAFEPVAVLSKLNGAWFIFLQGNAADGQGPERVYSCASSLVKAKRIAREMAESIGITGPFAWYVEEDDNWYMTGTDTEDDG